MTAVWTLRGHIMDDRSAKLGNALAKLVATQANFLGQPQHPSADILEYEQVQKRTLELFEELCHWQRQLDDLPN